MLLKGFQTKVTTPFYLYYLRRYKHFKKSWFTNNHYFFWFYDCFTLKTCGIIELVMAFKILWLWFLKKGWLKKKEKKERWLKNFLESLKCWFLSKYCFNLDESRISRKPSFWAFMWIQYNQNQMIFWEVIDNLRIAKYCVTNCIIICLVVLI